MYIYNISLFGYTFYFPTAQSVCVCVNFHTLFVSNPTHVLNAVRRVYEFVIIIWNKRPGNNNGYYYARTKCYRRAEVSI